MIPKSNTSVGLSILEVVQMISPSHVARDYDSLVESSSLAVAPVTTFSSSDDQFHPWRSAEEPQQEGERQKSSWLGLLYIKVPHLILHLLRGRDWS